MIDYGGKLQRGVEEGRPVHQELHALRHQLLLGISPAIRLQPLAPAVDLFAQIDLGRADVGTREAERARRDVVGIPLRVAQHAEVDAYRSGDEVGIGITSAPPIDRASVHTLATADAVEGADVLGISQDVAPPVVHDDDVKLATGCRTAVVRRVRGDGLSRTGASQKAGEDTERFEVRHDLLHPERRDVELGERRAHVGISLVGANDDFPRRGNGEVRPSHGDIGMEELVAEVPAGGMGEVRRVGVAWLGAQLLFHHLTHLLALDVDGGHDDVARFQVHELEDALAQVAFDYIDALCHEVRVHLTFLGKHGLALDEVLGGVATEQLEDDAVVLLGVLRPMDDGTVGDGVALELLEQGIQMTIGIELDGRGQIA